jgi:hypothetical protein
MIPGTRPDSTRPTGNGTPRGDRGRPLQMMDAGSTGLSFQTHGHAITDLVKNPAPFGVLACASLLREAIPRAAWSRSGLRAKK